MPHYIPPDFLDNTGGHTPAETLCLFFALSISKSLSPFREEAFSGR